MHELEKSDLLALLWKVIDEQHKYLDAHQSRVSFYSSFITALIAATVAGALNAKEVIHYLFLLVGPFLIWRVAGIAKSGTFSFYRLFLETVTIRAKLEQKLGMTVGPVTSAEVGADASPSKQAYWSTEALIPDRHLESRKKHSSSGNFIDASVGKGVDLATVELLKTSSRVAFFLTVALFLAAFLKWLAA